MGRPYSQELTRLAGTYEWSTTADLSELAEHIAMLRSGPLLVVGSGGSLSACQFVARLHEMYARLSARALTPLEFLRHPVPQSAGVLLLSASGRNPDILAAARHAVSREYSPVVAVCARTATPLGRLLGLSRHACVAEFDAPSGKDGFLATNSLLLTEALLSRAYGAVLPPRLPALDRGSFSSRSLEWQHLVETLVERRIVVVLASGWAAPAASDLESKWSEIGFGVVTTVDSRNFAHGRHYGFYRQRDEAVVLGMRLGTVDDGIATTFAGLPSGVMTAALSSPLTGAAGTLDLTVQVIQLAGDVGSRLGLDPGRPSVPAFGRRLYHAGMPKAFRPGAKEARARFDGELAVGEGPALEAPEDLWILRKVTPALWQGSSESTRKGWREACQEWVRSARSAAIGGLVLDYDGTVCEPDERFGVPAASVGHSISRLAKDGLRVGVASGRGSSVLKALRSVVVEDLWREIIVGMYNGGVICRLNEDPPTIGHTAEVLETAATLLENSPALRGIAQMRRRPTQLTVFAKQPLPEGLLHRMALEVFAGARLPLRIVSSGHTIDILPESVSKLAVLDTVRSLIASSSAGTPFGGRGKPTGPPAAVMTIGDQGQAWGNDGSFLAHRLGLSVESVSSAFDSCWNVAPAGSRRTAALLGYLNGLSFSRSGSYRWSVHRASQALPHRNLKPDPATETQRLLEQGS